MFFGASTVATKSTSIIFYGPTRKICRGATLRMVPAYGDYMSLFGHRLRCCHERLSSCGKARSTRHAMKSAIWAITGAILSLAATSRGYVLEGQSWPAGTVVVLQLSLGRRGPHASGREHILERRRRAGGKHVEFECPARAVRPSPELGRSLFVGRSYEFRRFREQRFRPGIRREHTRSNLLQILGIDHEGSGHAL